MVHLSNVFSLRVFPSSSAFPFDRGIIRLACETKEGPGFTMCKRCQHERTTSPANSVSDLTVLGLKSVFHNYSLCLKSGLRRPGGSVPAVLMNTRAKSTYRPHVRCYEAWPKQRSERVHFICVLCGWYQHSLTLSRGPSDHVCMLTMSVTHSQY